MTHQKVNHKKRSAKKKEIFHLFTFQSEQLSHKTVHAAEQLLFDEDENIQYLKKNKNKIIII